MEGRKAKDIDGFKNNIMNFFSQQQESDVKSESQEKKPQPTQAKKTPAKNPSNDTVVTMCKSMANTVSMTILHDIAKAPFFDEDTCKKLDEFLGDAVEELEDTLVAIVSHNYDDVPEGVFEELNKATDGAFKIEELGADEDNVTAAIGGVVTLYHVKAVKFLNQFHAVPSFILQAVVMGNSFSVSAIVGCSLGALWGLQNG